MYLPQMEMTGFGQMPGINLPHKTMGNPECWILQKRHPKKTDNQRIDNQLADNQLAENELAERRQTEMGEVKAQKRDRRAGGWWGRKPTRGEHGNGRDRRSGGWEGFEWE